MALLENALAKGSKKLDGEIIFKLYDTYGFPYDLTADICRERNIELDETGFEREMEAQRARARAAQSFKANAQLSYEGQDTEFKGYSERQTESKVLALYKDGEQVNELNEGDEGAIVIDFTPFYAESGGQVGDVGYIFAGENRFEVHDTQKIKAAVFGQFGVQTSGRLKVGDSVTAKVDDEIRNANMRNHSATHLMHKALRDVLGEHVEQKGSFSYRRIHPFRHFPSSSGNCRRNRRSRTPRQRSHFGQRCRQRSHYEHGRCPKNRRHDALRRKIRRRSTRTANGRFLYRIVRRYTRFTHRRHRSLQNHQRGGIAAGVRRIEAITGLNALKWAQEQERLVKDIIAETKAQTEKDVLAKIQAGAAHAKALEKELARAKAELAVHAGAKLLDDAKDLGAAKLVAAQSKPTQPPCAKS